MRLTKKRTQTQTSRAQVLGWMLAVLMALIALPAVVQAETGEGTTTWDQPLPLWADWAREQGIDLPKPFGTSIFVVTMSRDIEIIDVRVSLPGNAPVSVSDVADFKVRNNTTLMALKLDTWVLPLLNVYALAGTTLTDSRLNALVTLDRPILNPAKLELVQEAAVGGPLLGGGATMVGGYGPWFAMVDANYNYTAIKELDGGIAAWFVSSRTGWSGTGPGFNWRTWVGAAWLETQRTLVMTEESPALGTVKVEVDMRPVDPWTYQIGGSFGIDKRWEFMVEVGSNFADAFVGVFSASFRF